MKKTLVTNYYHKKYSPPSKKVKTPRVIGMARGTQILDFLN